MRITSHTAHNALITGDQERDDGCHDLVRCECGARVYQSRMAAHQRECPKRLDEKGVKRDRRKKCDRSPAYKERKIDADAAATGEPVEPASRWNRRWM